MSAVIVQELAQLNNVLLATHKGCGNKIDVLLNTKNEIGFVLVAEVGHINVEIRNIDALVVGERTADVHAANNIGFGGVGYGHGNLTVVEQNAHACIKLARQIGVCDSGTCGVAQNIGGG